MLEVNWTDWVLNLSLVLYVVHHLVHSPSYHGNGAAAPTRTVRVHAGHCTVHRQQRRGRRRFLLRGSLLRRPFGGIEGGRTETVVWHLHHAPLVIVLAAAVALEALPDQPEEHFAAKVAERGRLVRVHGQRVGIHDLGIVDLLQATAQR